MIAQMEYLNLPAIVIICVVAFLVISNIIGEILELKGKVVPEFIKMRKYFERKKQEREELRKIPLVLSETQKTLSEVNAHYNSDSITKRNDWIGLVNKKLEENDKSIKELCEKLDKNSEITMSMFVDSKRNYLISFSSLVSDGTKPVTREQFRRAFKVHNEYEAIIEEYGITNGEVDVAMKLINEAYEKHMKNHTFLEDVRGY